MEMYSILKHVKALNIGVVRWKETPVYHRGRGQRQIGLLNLFMLIVKQTYNESFEFVVLSAITCILSLRFFV